MENKILIEEWFGGIGAATQALKILHGDNVSVNNYVELDKHAVNSYNAINGTNFKPKDINELDVSNYPEIDILIAGWPCQDYSVAGLGKGLDGNRSSLILTTIDKIKQMQIKPKKILLENVKGMLSKKHSEGLEMIKNLFRDLGYKWEQVLLNSKHFGVPQSRERVYIVLTRNDIAQKTISHLNQRQDIDKVLKDVLDFSEPTETHQVKNNGNIIFFTNNMSQYNGKIIKVDIDKLNNQSKDKINKVGVLGTFENSEFKEVSFGQDKSVHGVDGMSPTLTTSGTTFKAKVVFEETGAKQVNKFTGVDGQYGTLTHNNGTGNFILNKKTSTIHYRKLSTLECWRLMGFSDEAHNKVKSMKYLTKSGKEKRLISDSQLAKQAGNSIVVNVLVEIFKNI